MTGMPNRSTHYVLQKRYLQTYPGTEVPKSFQQYGPWTEILRRPYTLDGLRECYRELDRETGDPGNSHNYQHLYRIVPINIGNNPGAELPI